MIHVFGCAKDLCQLPGKACLAFAEACGDLEKCTCGPVEQCCDGALSLCGATGKFFSDFMDQPLSTYVVVKALLSACGLAACVSALREPSLGDCAPGPGGVGLRPWLTAQAAFMCLNLIFAPYFQRQVWKEVVEESRSLLPGAAGAVRVPAERIHESFRRVLMYNVPVCLYSVVLVAFLAWSILGESLALGPGCNPGGRPGTAARLGTYFFAVSCVYVGCYYCCKCCASAVVLQGVPDDPNYIPAPSAPPLDGHGVPVVTLGGAAPGEPAEGASGGASKPSRREAAKATLLSCACAYFVPPLGVYWRFGCGWRLLVCCMLTVTAYIPGVIFACLVIGFDGGRAAKAREAAAGGGRGRSSGHYIAIS